MDITRGDKVTILTYRAETSQSAEAESLAMAAICRHRGA